MKLKFKTQDYQTKAVQAVVDAFKGQPYADSVQYTIDPGQAPTPFVHRFDMRDADAGQQSFLSRQDEEALNDPGASSGFAFDDAGLRNSPIALTEQQLLENIQDLTTAQMLLAPDKLVYSKAGRGVPNLDVEMETGTGKTYVYIKTIMELNKAYGWSKFIIVVPSIAIREGVLKTFHITHDHFHELYGHSPQAFIYSSSNLTKIDEFSSNPGIQVMIINIQAFNATGKDQRRIYEELDEFRSRRPVDVIKANNPVVIIDEPQKISAPKSQDSIANLNPMAVLRYSATHKDKHNLVHRLDALDAYNQKLVKKISVLGLEVAGIQGVDAYLYLQGFKETRGFQEPVALLDIEVLQASGTIKRKTVQVRKGDDLHTLSNGLEAYTGYVVSNIFRGNGTQPGYIEFTNLADSLYVGMLAGAPGEDAKRRIQIKQVIKAHLQKESQLFSQGIKVLSLFFIDEVARYRNYDRPDAKGDYAIWFEELYEEAVSELNQEIFDSPDYQTYLDRFAGKSDTVHAGYFSIDKKGNYIDGKVAARGDEKGQSQDTDAYDLILKNKERLLSLDEPVRFIFSHSALREGWDNPNVFTLGMLKTSNNETSRRQEIGRGLRLAVNQLGERQDDPNTVHDINVLTVVTDESYTDFVAALQRETKEALAGRPSRVESPTYFSGQTVTDNEGASRRIDDALSTAIYNHLVRNDYLNDEGYLTDTYLQHKQEDARVTATSNQRLAPLIDFVWPMVDVLIIGDITPGNAHRQASIELNNTNFERAEFKKLWNHINRKATYRVDFDSEELIHKAVTDIDSQLAVTRLSYTVVSSSQHVSLTDLQVKSGDMFSKAKKTTFMDVSSVKSSVQYDLVGKVAEKTQLTRKTAGIILHRISKAKFAEYALNPEDFIAKVTQLINSAKANFIIQHLAYNLLDERFDTNDVFAALRTTQSIEGQDELDKHIYSYLLTDSKIERDFAKELEANDEVLVYAKLPGAFYIPTPLGNYNPDWAVVFKDGAVKHLYFIAETKGSTNSLDLRGFEDGKIRSAERFFERLNQGSDFKVSFKKVSSYQDMMNVMRQPVSA